MLKVTLLQLDIIGVPFSTADGKACVVCTTANISYSAAWSSETVNRFARNKRKENFGEPLRILSLSGIRNVDKLLDWIKTAKLDPNDPTNAEIIQLANDLKPSSDANYFRLEPLQEMFDFCSQDDIMTNHRFQLLQQRHKGVAYSTHPKMIPPTDNEVGALLLAEKSP